MPVKIEPNAEPIPGYRLIERLGGGGFGEVWKAEAPGGLMKAIKFVYGDLYAADDEDGSRAGQELKALSRVKTVRHAYILSIERFDIIDGQLIIITELADRTLWDRFRETRGTGLPGVPREELLGYMEETAEALDLMNEEFQLQHLDIKPQNLFLVHNHIKVADFGLAKDMGDKAAATITGGVTPVYAAPETFDGWLSRFSDQYSLAIVYQEMLTGQRPFTGSTMRQLVLQHLQVAPDLNSLPVADRPIIGRALNKNPDERYPTCREFVQGLRAATLTAGAKPSPVPMPRPRIPGAAPPTNCLPLPHEPVDGDSQVTQGGRGSTASRAADLSEPAEKASSLENRPQVLPPRPEGDRNKREDTPAEADPAGGTIPTAAFGPRHAGQLASPRPDESEAGAGLLHPALVVGLGKLGLDTLRQIRKLISAEFGHADALPHVRLLGIDTDPEAVQAAGHGDAQEVLRNYETLLARLHRPSHYLKAREGKPATPDAWFNAKLLFRIPRQQTGAGLRPLGRLAFVGNYRLISRRLEGELQSCTAKDGPPENSEEANLGLRARAPRVYVVAGLAGATGGAIFIDTAYVIRHLLRQIGFPNAEIIGVLYLPAADRDGSRSPALANAYAALTELNHYSSGQVFSARYDEGETGPGSSFTEAGPPFQRCVMLSLPKRTTAGDESAETVAQAGQLIYRDLATELGPALDEAHRSQQQAYYKVGQAAYQSVGMYRISWPRRSLVARSARNLCKRLVEGWITKDAAAITDEVRTWSLEQWETLGLRPEGLIAAHHEKCEQTLEQAPDRMFQGIINPLSSALTRGTDRDAGELNMGPVVQAMDYLEKLLGLPDECRPMGVQRGELGTIEKALTDASEAISSQCEQKLLEAVVQLIEQPSYRLAGAEEALRQFCVADEQALETQEPLAKELYDKSVLLHQRIQALLETPPVQSEARTTSLWKFGRRGADKASPADELVTLLKSFAKARFQSLILFHVNRLYVSLRGFLSDQIREVEFCRTNLRELARTFAAPLAQGASASAAYEQYLLPVGCAKLDDAVAKLDKEIGPDKVAVFDQRIQELVRRQFHALVQVCTGPALVLKTLAPAMLNEGAAFLEPLLQGASVADLFVKQKGGTDEDPRNALLEAYDEAAPELSRRSSPKELCVVVLPNDEQGETLRDALADVLPTAKVVACGRSDEIVFYREQLDITASDLEQFVPAALDAYRQREAQDPGALHCREDVVHWQAPPTPSRKPELARS